MPHKFTRQGGYFCVLLLPMAYPSPKAVRHKLITAIRPSMVNIGIPSFSKISVRKAEDFYVSKIHCNQRVTVPLSKD